MNVEVCKSFLCKSLNLGENRLRTIQTKILEQRSLKDERGNHVGALKLTNEMTELIDTHCYNQRHRKAHYDNSSLYYFENPELDLITLYYSFTEFYESEKNCECPISESSYTKYFNHHLPFTFKRPHTDMCDLCEINVINNSLESSEMVKHKQMVQEYQV